MNLAPDLASPAAAAPDHIRNLPRYVPGKPASEPRREADPGGPVRKMASNENPLGASPQAVLAMQQVLADVSAYPDPAGFDLKAALAPALDVAEEQIVLGNGSSELIDLAARAVLRVGDEAVYSQYSFIAYPLAVKMTGGVGISVPAHEHGHDLDAMGRAITGRTRLVFLANPNNPTGTLLTPGQIRAFLQNVPAHVLVVLDEAYVEYVPPELRTDSRPLLREFPNLLALRTFSKIHGLAGMRIGYGTAHPDVAEMLNRIRPVFNVNTLAQRAALAALGDAAFVAASFRTNRAGMAQLATAFDRLRLPFIPSFGNFVAVDFARAANPARGVNERLLAQGVIVRPLDAYGLPDHLRVTVGTHEDNLAFIAALERALA